MSMSSQGIGLFGAGSNSGVVAELLAVGAMDAYLIKGASVTFFRFRYARHTNFAMEAVGQPFISQPQFGGHSKITLDRVGDLLYYMYVVIDLPGIKAVRRGSRAHQSSSDYDEYDYGGQDRFPAANGRSVARDADAKAFRKYQASQYNNNNNASGSYDDDTLASGQHDGGSTHQARAAWYRQAYNGVADDTTTTECASVPQDERPWVHWANAVGQLIVRRAVLVVGNHGTDQLYSDYLYMWEELSGKAGKRLREMIGKRKSRKQLIKDAKQDQRLYVPLPWYFTQTSGNALPFCSLQFHGVSIHVEWEQLHKCVIKSSDDVEVVKVKDGTRLTSNDLNAWLDTVYVYLDTAERDRFATASFDQLITQVQMQTASNNRSNEITMNLQFNHPVIELIWAVRRKANETANAHFNYSGIDGRDPIAEVSLHLNNLARFAGREGRYYRLVTPYQHHSSVPKSYIYQWGPALFPEDPQPSGSVNLSRIDSTMFRVRLQDGLTEPATLIVFARNWNVLRFSEGMAGTLFSN